MAAFCYWDNQQVDAMTDETEQPTVRRRVRRNSRGGLSDSTTTEGGDIADLNDMVESRSSPPITDRLSDVENEVGSRTDAPADFTPANRMREVQSSSRATAYEREYRLKLLHRMIMRNVPLDQIAKELSVSVGTVIRDRKELYKKLREAAQGLDINEIIGDTLGFYQEVKGMGLRAASTAKAPLNMRLAAMRTALAATNDMHRFLEAVGVYDVLRYRVSDNDASTDIERLVDITEAILGGKAMEVDPLQTIADLPFLGEEDDLQLLR